MGNKLLSECHNQSNNFDENTGFTTQNYKIQTIQKLIQNHHKHTKNSQTYQIQTFTGQKSIQIEQIYKKMQKQKIIAYSIQREQFLSIYDVSNLKQLIQKVFNQNKNKNINQFNTKNNNFLSNSNLSTSINQNNKKSTNLNIKALPETFTFSQKTSIQHEKNIDIQIIQFYLGYERNSKSISVISQNDKNVYRSRSLSKQIEDYNYQDKIQQQSNYQSIMEIQKINIYNKKYIYIGFVDQQQQPHGSGRLKQKQKRNNINNIIQNISKYNSKQQLNTNQDKKPQKFNKQDLIIFIEANFVHGLIQSEDCLIIFKQGHFYRGGFFNQNFNSKGKLYINPHLELIGNFSNGLLNGKGKSIYSDGGCYEGNFLNGLRQGKGRMIWKSQLKQKNNLQIVYEGYFKDDKMNGLGNLKTPNYQYWGPFINNIKQGKGTIKFKDGNKFQGWFQKDEIKGYGQLHYPNGNVQKGIFPLNK